MIELENISKLYNSEVLLDKLNIKFHKNKINCLLGRSGSGKTTILKIIAGLVNDYDGNLYINRNYSNDLKIQNRNIGWVPQHQLLFPGLNVWGNLAYGLKARNLPREEINKRIDEIARLVGVSHLLKRDTNQLSGGERQRVAIGRALAPNPQLLLLDEPFSSLDAPERDRMALVVRQIQLETSVTVIHVTHSPHEAELIADYIFILAKGQILQHGDTIEIFNHPNSIEVAQLLSIPNVVRANCCLPIKNDAIVPVDAISFGGDINARILTITTDRIHLLLNNNLKLEMEKIDSLTYKHGDNVNISIDTDKIYYL